MRPIQTKPPETPNPITWRAIGNARLGDYILGEDTVDLVSLGFCGDTETVTCTVCGEVLGHTPVELVGEEFGDITSTHITPVLAWHHAKHHPDIA